MWNSFKLHTQIGIIELINRTIYCGEYRKALQPYSVISKYGQGKIKAKME